MNIPQLAIGLASFVMAGHHVSRGLAAMQQGPRPPRRPAPGPSRPLAAIGSPAAAMPRSMALHRVATLEERVAHIRERVRTGRSDPRVYGLARKIVTQRCGAKWCVPEKDNLAEAKAVYNFMRKNVRYTSDPLAIDAYQHPALTLSLRAGDCDDYSATTCALLLSLGIPCRLKVIQTKDSRTPNHIYPQAGLPRARPARWYTMDSSVDATFGWEAPASLIAKSWVYPAY